MAVPVGHVLSDREVVSLADFADEPFLMSSRSVNPVYFDSIVGVCRAHGHNPRILHEVHSIVSQIAYVSCGQGVALVPISTARMAPENVRLVPLVKDILVVTTAVAWSTESYAPVTTAAVDVLRALTAESNT